LISEEIKNIPLFRAKAQKYNGLQISALKDGVTIRSRIKAMRKWLEPTIEIAGSGFYSIISAQ